MRLRTGSPRSSWAMMNARSEGSFHSPISKTLCPIRSERAYVCSWCELHGSQLFLLPTAQSGARTRQVRYPGDADILGRVTAVTMRIADMRDDTQKMPPTDTKL